MNKQEIIDEINKCVTSVKTLEEEIKKNLTAMKALNDQLVLIEATPVKRRFKEGHMVGKTGPKFLPTWHEFYRTVKDLDIMVHYPARKKQTASLLRTGTSKLNITMDELVDVVRQDESLHNYESLKKYIESAEPTITMGVKGGLSPSTSERNCLET